jgi:hypothetical protein
MIGPVSPIAKELRPTGEDIQHSIVELPGKLRIERGTPTKGLCAFLLKQASPADHVVTRQRSALRMCRQTSHVLDGVFCREPVEVFVYHSGGDQSDDAVICSLEGDFDDIAIQVYRTEALVG